MKFAFVSQVLPPNWSGQSTVIYRVLSGLNPSDYCLISQDYGDAKAHRQKKDGRLSGKYYYLPRRSAIMKGWRLSLIRRANIWLRAREIARIVRRERCEAIMACPGDFFDLPAAFLASRWTQVGFYPYMLDYYSEQSAGFKSSGFVRRFEPVMMKGAAGIIVPNEFMGKELRRRYGVASVVVRNPCDVYAYNKLPPYRANGHGEFKIVFTGSIYNAHFDAFHNLLAAIKTLGRWKIKLHLYTNQSASDLEKHGISGPIVLHGAQETSLMPEVQQKADLLFLPLAFEAPFPGLIRTSAPGKTGEYLAAGRPVLVHAPPDSFLAWYFREHDCGLVIDENNPASVAEAIERLLTDSNLQQRLSANARRRAEEEFSLQASRSAFARVMKLDLPAPNGAASVKPG